MRSAWPEGNPEAGRPVPSQRRLPGASERPPERGPAEQGDPEQRLAGPLGGSWRGRDLTGIEVAVAVGAGKASKPRWEDQGRERDCGSGAPVLETHSGFVMNALGSPRAAQLSSL